jgi:hypothetical protein
VKAPCRYKRSLFFVYPEGQVELWLAHLDITASELDRMLYPSWTPQAKATSLDNPIEINNWGSERAFTGCPTDPAFVRLSKMIV